LSPSSAQQASKEIENGSTYANVKEKFCYEYQYDAKKRMISKRVSLRCTETARIRNGT